MLSAVAYITVSVGLLIDFVNIYLTFVSLKRKCASKIILIPAILYLLGVIILAFTNLDWKYVIITLFLLLLIHIFAIILLPLIIRIIWNVLKGKSIFDLSPYHIEEGDEEENKGNKINFESRP